MKFKDFFEDIPSREGSIRFVDHEDGRFREMIVGATSTRTVHVYLTTVETSQDEECVMLAKMMDDTKAFSSLFSDKRSMQEVANKWPELYRMVQAGFRDAFADAAVIVLPDMVALATKIDPHRMLQDDWEAYCTDKLEHIAGCYTAISEEMRTKPLDELRVKHGQFWDSARTGWTIGRVISTVVGMFGNWIS